MTIGVLLNASKAIDLNAVAGMSRILSGGGARVLTDSLFSHEISAEKVASAELFEKSSLLIVFGGDGTLLSAARGAARHGNAVLGINFGRLGFLTEAEATDLAEVAAAVLSGEYTIEKRMMLTALMPDGSSFDVMNDAVVSRSLSLNMICCDVAINGRHFDSYWADGVLAATPTGSTAYSLSCGGPVINPRVDCIALSPVCPHNFRARPMVLSPDEIVTIGVNPQSKGARMDVDGIFAGNLEPGQSVRVEKSEISARFVRLKERSFYSVLRSKLMEG